VITPEVAGLAFNAAFFVRLVRLSTPIEF
jgi:hypothetical protein